MAVTGLTTFLWFDDQALAASDLYVATFGGERREVSTYPEGSRRPAGSVMTVAFRIFDHDVVALNGGPGFPHSEAVSFQVWCDDQSEIDRVWEALIAEGGAEGACGWCRDRFGASWQVLPRALPTLLAGAGDPDAGAHVYERLMGMSKIVIRELEG